MSSRYPTADEFEPGEVVHLASGGPAMTVLDVGRHTGMVFVRWLSPEGPAEHHFPAAMLREGEFSGARPFSR
jgi:uncharacterized protein YodC (DUF2158 family)